MTEARIGRLVVAALHESLATHLPFRVDFYEHWLQPPRLRSGSVGLASFLAVLSFLRQEGDVYDRIVSDAGQRAAEWVFADVSSFARYRWRWLSMPGRLRRAAKLVERLSADSSPEARCRVRWIAASGHLELQNSPFCNVRTRVTTPLCGFYAAAFVRFCALLNVGVDVRREACRAMATPVCTIAVRAAGATGRGETVARAEETHMTGDR
jgi:hypothetical protein